MVLNYILVGCPCCITPLGPETTKLYTIEVQVSEVTSIWFNGTSYVAVISKKSWSVQTVFTMEKIDIRHALAEVARDKRFAESLQ